MWIVSRPPPLTLLMLKDFPGRPEDRSCTLPLNVPSDIIGLRLARGPPGNPGPMSWRPNFSKADASSHILRPLGISTPSDWKLGTYLLPPGIWDSSCEILVMSLLSDKCRTQEPREISNVKTDGGCENNSNCRWGQWNTARLKHDLVRIHFRTLDIYIH